MCESIYLLFLTVLYMVSVDDQDLLWNLCTQAGSLACTPELSQSAGFLTSHKKAINITFLNITLP